jgi:hypothetical protein
MCKRLKMCKATPALFFNGCDGVVHDGLKGLPAQSSSLDQDDSFRLGQNVPVRCRLAGLTELADPGQASIGTRIDYARQSGYDTHAGQCGIHAVLLQELSSALLAFLDDLAAAKVAQRVVVLTFSEFGRTVSENASAGTDHSTSGPMFLAGPGVKAGPIGTTPRSHEVAGGS